MPGPQQQNRLKQIIRFPDSASRIGLLYAIQVRGVSVR